MAFKTLITLDNLSLILPHKNCFENFSATVPYGAKIAVTGNNGTGKSTLLKALNGQETFTEGAINTHTSAIAFVPQTIEDYQNLSGGERFNKALGLALAQNPDILLLDEPTNHLDISNKKSLLAMLQRFRGALIVVTHDRELLRRADTIWHIHDGKITVFNGNYDDYAADISIQKSALESRLNNLEKNKKAMHKKLMKEQDRAAKSKKHGEAAKNSGKWAPIIAGAMQRKAQQTAGGKKRDIFTKKEDINEQIKSLGVTQHITPSFTLSGQSGSGAPLFIMEGSAGYGAKLILRDINITVNCAEKVAIIGNNACGKSTLFKAILGQAARLGGTWNAPNPAYIGFLDQHYDNLPRSATPAQIIAAIKPQWQQADIRKHLNDFLFRKNEEANAFVQTLSGGERARLSLAAIACQVPRLLLLDEITNNIDLETKTHIEDILKTYPAAFMLISHDIDFVLNIGVDTIYKMQDGRLIKTDRESLLKDF